MWPLSIADLNSEGVKDAQQWFTEALEHVLQNYLDGNIGFIDDEGDNISDTESNDDNEEEDETLTYEPYEDDETEPIHIEEADEMDHDAFDKYIMVEVMLPQGDDSLALGIVKHHKHDHDGNVIGTSNPDPFLDSSIYEVKFADGVTQEYESNVIAEHLYSQIDEDGHCHVYFNEIIGH